MHIYFCPLQIEIITVSLHEFSHVVQVDFELTEEQL